MDYELAMIQINQDMEGLAEEYEGAASNERLWAKGSSDAETIRMHEENAEHNSKMAELYHSLARRALDLIETFQEEN